MADSKITALTEATSILSTDLLAAAIDPAGTPVTKKITIATLIQAVRALLNTPSGGVLNGKFSVTVASNNITVALKGLNGSDPSSTNTVSVVIGGVVRIVSAALSVTVNAGADIMNLSAVETMTKATDFNIVMGYNATDGVTIGFCRKFGNRKYSQWSTTSTNDNYLALSNRTTAAADDAYENVGRFEAAMSSSGSGYLWSVPTFTNDNLIHTPCNETRWMDFVPAVSCSGSMAHASDNVYLAKYKVVGNSFQLNMKVETVLSSTMSNEVRLTMPLTAVSTDTCPPLVGSVAYGAGTFSGVTFWQTTRQMIARRYDSANYTASTWGVTVNGSVII